MEEETPIEALSDTTSEVTSVSTMLVHDVEDDTPHWLTSAMIETSELASVETQTESPVTPSTVETRETSEIATSPMRDEVSQGRATSLIQEAEDTSPVQEAEDTSPVQEAEEISVVQDTISRETESTSPVRDVSVVTDSESPRNDEPSEPETLIVQDGEERLRVGGLITPELMLVLADQTAYLRHGAVRVHVHRVGSSVRIGKYEIDLKSKKREGDVLTYQTTGNTFQLPVRRGLQSIARLQRERERR